MVESTSATFFSMALSIFFVFNAIGFLPVLIALLAPYEKAAQKKIIFRELLIALFVLLLFTFFGITILQMVGISQGIIGIAGGFLLVLISLSLIFPRKEVGRKGMPHHEPLIVPIAIPGLAGPGSIATVMVFASHGGPAITALAVLAAWIPSFVILYLSAYIKNYLGEKGIQAVERLGGMLICLIGTQMLLSGIISVVKENF